MVGDPEREQDRTEGGAHCRENGHYSGVRGDLTTSAPAEICREAGSGTHIAAQNELVAFRSQVKSFMFCFLVFIPVSEASLHLVIVDHLIGVSLAPTEKQHILIFFCDIKVKRDDCRSFKSLRSQSSILRNS